MRRKPMQSRPSAVFDLIAAAALVFIAAPAVAIEPLD